MGATSVGPRAATSGAMLIAAVHTEVPVSVLGNQLVAYPTSHGAVRDAAVAAGLDLAALHPLGADAA